MAAMAEQVPLHEGAETSGIRRGQPDEFVEVHRVDLREVRTAGAVQAHERVVDRERRLTGRQSEHRRRFLPHLIDDERGGCRGSFVDAVVDLQLHIG